MIKNCGPADGAALYEYQRKLRTPYFFPVSFESWRDSMFHDVDGGGRPLFRWSRTAASFERGQMNGFVQYGRTAFGFDAHGRISAEVSYPVIRALYFDRGCRAAGRELLQNALSGLGESDGIYAFYHYFGMSCYARHGKLFEGCSDVRSLLEEGGFDVRRENVYYSSEPEPIPETEVQVVWGVRTPGAQQSAELFYDGRCVGECEVQYVNESEIVYLRWIYVNRELQNQGIGSECMRGLQRALQENGMRRLDTDTTLNNLRAQHYYEKNGFVRRGVTQSFFRPASGKRRI